MSSGTAPAGRVRGPVLTHPRTGRPPVWVKDAGEEWPGREVARANDGQAVLVSWVAGDGLGRQQWVRASQVRERAQEA